MAQLWLAPLVLFAATISVALGCGYQTCPSSYDTSKVQLHIISHSHDDVGWLSTPDGYADNDVNPLLSHVVVALQKNKARKFVEVEMYYFKRWWQRQTTATQDAVKDLVKSGQFTFANGGWCINDEASAHYNQIIDQMTFGIQFLRDTFGECAEPKLSWQIDPFGASREQANLFAQMGFDGHVTNRGTGHLKGEFSWNTSLAHSIFTTHLHNHYSAPSGFNFEDADEITDANKLDKARTIAELGKQWNRDYGSKGHVLIPFGDDFRYKNAERWFSNLDKLIEIVNKVHPDVHLHYSSPHCYIKAIRDLKPKLDVRSEDYFPLWTGYYSSRPQVKYLDRYANNLLQAAKQLEVFAELGNTQSLLFEGKNELAVLQHHDAISGTSRPFVMLDYKERLVNAIKSVERVISQALDKLAHKNESSQPGHLHNGPFVYTTVNISDYVKHLEGQGFAAVIYNPVVQEATTWVRIPVSEANTYKVFDQNGDEVKHVSAVPISNKVKSLIGHHQQITYELVFSASLPALGFTTYFVTKGTEHLKENAQKMVTNSDKDFLLKGKNFELIVDHTNGKIKSISKDGKSHKVAQTFAYYPSQKSSSAYEFCPSGNAVDLSQSSSLVHFAKYEGFSEVTQKVNDWIWQTIRVYENKEYVEFDQTVGPLEDKDDISKEVITRFETDLNTKGVFYTDANGRQDIKRQHSNQIHECGNQKSAIWYNYYPVTTAAIIKDEGSGLQLTLIPDRSVGASSQKDGELEMMIHRRLLYNIGGDINLNDKDVDGKGVVARGKVFLYLSNKQEAADNLRRENRDVFMQPIVSFRPIANIAGYKAEYNTHFTALKTKLPDNVHLLTLENWGNVKNNEVLVRFENFYQPDDLSKLNTVAHVPLDAFVNVHLDHIEKANLIVGQRKSENGKEVSLAAQEIATFVYKVKRTVAHSSCSFKWQKLIDHKLPAHAVRAGHEPSNAPLYVCRHKNVDLIPGKYNDALHCQITYGGKKVEFNDNDVEILTSADANYQWVPRHGGDPFPDDVYVAGHSANGLPIYVGRCATHGMQVGKIDEYFYYAYGNTEHKGVEKDCIDHEVLTC